MTAVEHDDVKLQVFQGERSDSVTSSLPPPRSASSWCCRDKKGQDVHIQGVVDPLLAESTPQEAPRPSCGTRVWTFLSGAVKSLHGFKVSGLLTVAAAVGTALTSIFPHTGISIASNLALGYFGQNMASHLSKKAEQAQSECAKTSTDIVTKIHQHTSLGTMMVTGFYAKSAWSVTVNCILGGMFVRRKLQSQNDISDLVPQSEKVERCFSKNVSLILATASALSFLGGVTGMLALNEATTPRVLSLATACAEYGVKGLFALLGYKVERYLFENRENTACKRIKKVIDVVEGVGIGVSLYMHALAPTNYLALVPCAPVGFFLGTSSSSLLRVNAIENQILEHEEEAQVEHVKKCSGGSILTHIVTTCAFGAIGVYFFLKGTQETVGFDVFFTMTPLFYSITRFVFSKNSSKDSIVRRAGHFLLHKSPQFISEELNYALSLLAAGCIPKTLVNARIFFTFQALLFGSVEGALFTVDQEEESMKGIENQEAKQKVLATARRAITRNHTRLDLLTKNLLNNLR